jgi:RHS repeat-associated protein
MAPGQNHRVVLSDDANEYVIGDAVKFVLETGSRAVVADAIRIVGETQPAGDFAATASTVLREYVMLDGMPLALIEGGQIRYVHADHLGTPQKMTDGSGALVWDAVYKPFGEAHAISGSANNPQRFPGQLYDPETGFHYNYFRDYAPGLGRYIESDPIGLWGGLNTYAYVGGNPASFVDPEGLTTITIPRPFPGTIPRLIPPRPFDPLPPIPMRFRCLIRCDVHPTSNLAQCQTGNNCPPWVEGVGLGSSANEAWNNAWDSANGAVPTGCYKRHCRGREGSCKGWQGGKRG